MSFCPFNEDELDDAKEAFAEAFYKERMRNPFAPDPFRAAMTLWPEDAGDLPKALWAVHSAKWHEAPDVVALIEQAAEDAIEQAEEEKMRRVRNKEAGKESILLRLYTRLDLENDSDKLVKIAAEIAKYQGLHEKPDPDEGAGRILGVIQHELKPLAEDGTVIPFADRVLKQQQKLQAELIEHEKELEAGDNARLVN